MEAIGTANNQVIFGEDPIRKIIRSSAKGSWSIGLHKSLVRNLRRKRMDRVGIQH